MVESKSGYFPLFINAHSEKLQKFTSISLKTAKCFYLAVGFLSLQEIQFGRKIGCLKKVKTGGATDMQSKVQID